MSKRKLIVYDKWLETLGGGEVVACSIAKAFEKKFETVLIGKKLISKEKIESFLGLPLKQTKLSAMTEDRVIKQKTNIFINSTYLDLTTLSRSINFLYVSFPHKIELNPIMDAFKNWISNFLKSSLPLPEINPTLESCWINGRQSFKLNKLTAIKFLVNETKNNYLIRLYIYIRPVTKQSFENIKYLLNEKQIYPNQFHYDHQNDVVQVSFNLSSIASPLILKIQLLESESEYYLIDAYAIQKSILLRPFLLLKKRIYEHLQKGYFSMAKLRLASYKKILCNSEFVKKWIQKYWHMTADVIYPPVNLIPFSDQIFVEKRNWICSVGRFFTLGHNKKQDKMIEAFKLLHASGNTDIELHLVGGADSSVETQTYMKVLKESAEGFPIFFHIGVNRNEVENIYKKSKIYWHAAGMGIDSEKEPIKLEHFGISPIEAISAGCYPILFEAGGLPETIYNLSLTKDAHLFLTIDELTSKTKKALEDYNIWQSKYFEIYQMLIKLYSQNEFEKNIRDAILNA